MPAIKMLEYINIGSFGSPVSMCLFWQWTRSTTWRLQPLLPTTCTIQLKHWRPIPSALLICLVSAHSPSCWVEIWIWMFFLFCFFLVTFSKPLCVFQGLAKRVGARLLLASTSEVYGGKRDFAQSSLSVFSPPPDNHIEFSHQSGCCLMCSFGNLISTGTIVFFSLWVSP